MDDSKKPLSEFRESLARTEEAVDRMCAQIYSALRVGVQSSQSTVTLNAGGIGLVIASVCCAVMFTLTVVGTAVGVVAYQQLRDEFAEVREDQRATKAYLQGIWQQAPHLKPKEKDSE